MQKWHLANGSYEIYIFLKNKTTERILWDINFFVYLILVFLQQKIDLSDFLIQLSNEKLLCL